MMKSKLNKANKAYVITEESELQVHQDVHRFIDILKQANLLKPDFIHDVKSKINKFGFLDKTHILMKCYVKSDLTKSLAEYFPEFAQHYVTELYFKKYKEKPQTEDQTKKEVKKEYKKKKMILNQHQPLMPETQQMAQVMQLATDYLKNLNYQLLLQSQEAVFFNSFLQQNKEEIQPLKIAQFLKIKDIIIIYVYHSTASHNSLDEVHLTFEQWPALINKIFIQKEVSNKNKGVIEKICTCIKNSISGDKRIQKTVSGLDFAKYCLDLLESEKEFLHPLVTLNPRTASLPKEQSEQKQNEYAKEGESIDNTRNQQQIQNLNTSSDNTTKQQIKESPQQQNQYTNANKKQKPSQSQELDLMRRIFDQKNSPLNKTHQKHEHQEQQKRHNQFDWQKQFLKSQQQKLITLHQQQDQNSLPHHGLDILIEFLQDSKLLRKKFDLSMHLPIQDHQSPFKFKKDTLRRRSLNRRRSSGYSGSNSSGRSSPRVFNNNSNNNLEGTQSSNCRKNIISKFSLFELINSLLHQFSRLHWDSFDKNKSSNESQIQLQSQQLTLVQFMPVFVDNHFASMKTKPDLPQLKMDFCETVVRALEHWARHSEEALVIKDLIVQETVDPNVIALYLKCKRCILSLKSNTTARENCLDNIELNLSEWPTLINRIFSSPTNQQDIIKDICAKVRKLNIDQPDASHAISHFVSALDFTDFCIDQYYRHPTKLIFSPNQSPLKSSIVQQQFQNQIQNLTSSSPQIIMPDTNNKFFINMERLSESQSNSKGKQINQSILNQNTTLHQSSQSMTLHNPLHIVNKKPLLQDDEQLVFQYKADQDEQSQNYYNERIQQLYSKQQAGPYHAVSHSHSQNKTADNQNADEIEEFRSLGKNIDYLASLVPQSSQSQKGKKSNGNQVSKKYLSMGGFDATVNLNNQQNQNGEQINKNIFSAHNFQSKGVQSIAYKYIMGEKQMPNSQECLRKLQEEKEDLQQHGQDADYLIKKWQHESQQILLHGSASQQKMKKRGEDNYTNNQQIQNENAKHIVVIVENYMKMAQNFKGLSDLATELITQVMNDKMDAVKMNEGLQKLGIYSKIALQIYHHQSKFANFFMFIFA